MYSCCYSVRLDHLWWSLIPELFFSYSDVMVLYALCCSILCVMKMLFGAGFGAFVLLDYVIV
jgi:hypothetical protein